VAGHLVVGQHVFDFFLVARHGDANPRLVTNRMQAASTGRLEEHTAAADERRAVEKVAIVELRAGEVGFGRDAVIDHPLSFVGIDVDAPPAALLFAGVSSTVRLLEESK
jgi:hypothetical protein